MAEFFEKWKSGLAKTSKTAFGQLAQLFGATEITPETWEDLETLLIQADIGIETTSEILEELRIVVRDQGLINSHELSEALRAELRARLDPAPVLRWENKPSVIMVAGVNGSLRRWENASGRKAKRSSLGRQIPSVPRRWISFRCGETGSRWM
jgi:fused signal recognition particle receptor